MILGTLGRKRWHRCRSCGMDYADDTVCPACGADDDPSGEEQERQYGRSRRVTCAPACTSYGRMSHR